MSVIQISLITVISFVLTVLLMPFIIRYFRAKQLGQMTLDEGPKWHAEKSGTPTMGGVAIIIVSILTAFFASILLSLLTVEMGILLFIFLLYGTIGFIDDYLKVVLKRNLGLTSKQKFLAQIIGGIVFYIILQFADVATTLPLPFLGQIDFGILYAFFIVFWLVGFSNATNLTDGIDGLMATTGTVAFTTYAIIAYIQSQYDIMLFCISVVGALVGFFMFNRKPAKIFMGDVGSLALGAALASISILLKQEWSLLLIGLVFVIETASVMLQVSSFKLRGKRIFKMSPIHHHFEMEGLNEWQIVGLFGLFGLICSLVALWIVL